MSAKKTPWVGLLLKSPERPLRQNVWPSTSVMRPVGSPRLVGSEASTHGLGCTGPAFMTSSCPMHRRPILRPPLVGFDSLGDVFVVECVGEPFGDGLPSDRQ